jgi:hypothetical protein
MTKEEKLEYLQYFNEIAPNCKDRNEAEQLVAKNFGVTLAMAKNRVRKFAKELEFELLKVSKKVKGYPKGCYNPKETSKHIMCGYNSGQW